MPGSGGQEGGRQGNWSGELPYSNSRRLDYSRTGVAMLVAPTRGAIGILHRDPAGMARRRDKMPSSLQPSGPVVTFDERPGWGYQFQAGARCVITGQIPHVGIETNIDGFSRKQASHATGAIKLSAKLLQLAWLTLLLCRT